MTLDNPLREAEIIVQEALSLTTLDLHFNTSELTKEENETINNILLRRQKGEPLQYITGKTTFLGLPIKVGKGVLIPRPETELMAEYAINHLRAKGFDIDSGFNILDLCTGSGCIALALGLHFPQSTIIASDISMEALYYAKENALRNNISNIYFVAGDLLSPFRYDLFHLIISNPPYIKTSEIPKLQREIKGHEPINALDGGEEGTDFYNRIFDNVSKFIHNHGSLILELGYGQSGKVRAMAQRTGFKNISIIKDYSGINRIMIANGIKSKDN